MGSSSRGTWGICVFFESANWLSHVKFAPGDIGFLRHFPHLQVLILRRSRVSGDIGVLREKKMRCLDLSGSRVNGSIEALQLDEMEFLNLVATKVSGGDGYKHNEPI